MDLTNSFGMELRERSLWFDEEGIWRDMRFDKQHHAFKKSVTQDLGDD